MWFWFWSATEAPAAQWWAPTFTISTGKAKPSDGGLVSASMIAVSTGDKRASVKSGDRFCVVSTGTKQSVISTADKSFVTDAGMSE